MPSVWETIFPASSWDENRFATRRKKEIMNNEGQLVIFSHFLTPSFIFMC